MGDVLSSCCISRETEEHELRRPMVTPQKGHNMFEARKKAREAEETMVSNSPPPPELAPVLFDCLPVESLAPGKWWIHGLHEQQALKAGLRRLDNTWDAQDIHILQSGNAKLLREGLLQDLISGKRHLKAVPMCDISAAQGDVPHLTLRQLLRMRVLNLDYAPLGEGAAAVQAFIQKVDALLFRRIGLAALGNMFGDLNEAAEHRLGRDLAMITAAAATLQEPCWWVCFADHHRFWFDPTSFKASTIFPRSGGVLEITDSSKVDPHSKGMQRCLDWKVCLMVREDQVSPVRLELQLSNKQLKAGGYGANVSAPRLSQGTLMNQLGALKKTGNLIA